MPRYNFSTMSAEDQRYIASKGGKRAHELGKAHQWTSEQAKEAAAKSVAVRQAKRKKGNAA
jgi:hypothetical protein